MSHETHSTENVVQPSSALPVLLTLLVFVGAVIASIVLIPLRAPEARVPVILFSALTVLLTLTGFYVVNPNMSRVLVRFGTYRGTVRKRGFFWTIPFTSKRPVSLKANNAASETIKVNDLHGSPIEIGAVVVWCVADTTQALFDVEDYTKYVDIQIEAAVRQLASMHPYEEPVRDTDAGEEDDVVSLLGDSEHVAEELKLALGERLARGGIEVLEARLSHLAYAPEIASAMLQRQQADAIISARKKIVEGAVGMVEQALNDLGKRGVVELDDDRRAALVGNLLVVLCGQATPQPIVNTGSFGS